MATLAPAVPPVPAAEEAAPPIELDERSRSKAVVASQWRLMYWRFRRHRLAVAATIVIFVFYLIAMFAEFIAPMDPNKVSNIYRYVPPQPITFFDQNGHFTLRPGVYGLKGVRNPETLRFTYAVDKSQWAPIGFFVRGDPYKFWGIWPTNIHLIGLGATQGAPSAITGVVPPPDTSGPGAGSGAGASGGSTGIGQIGGFGGSTGSSGTGSSSAPAGGSTAAGTSGGFTGIGSIGGFGGSAGSTTSTGATTATGTANDVPVATVAPAATTQPASGTVPSTTSTTTGATTTTGTTAATNEAPFYLMGTDRLGRDMFSRIVYGARISLSVGLLGVAFSFIVGVILGGISGFYGGTIDNVIQRVIEFVRSVPTLPLLMGLAAAVPPRWPPTYVYFWITLILALFGWTGLARVVRGRFLTLREEDFITAARFSNCSEPRIIFRHMVPAFTSHLIAAATLALPAMILSETSLSFLGIGLRPPAISWGVLLQEAQNLQTVSLFPWLLLPCAPIVLIILSFNFMGDGLRDAADPYAR